MKLAMALGRGFGALSALSLNADMPLLPEMRLSRGVHRYEKGSRRRRSTYHVTNGERECARRRRQIAEGRLKAENGLEV